MKDKQKNALEQELESIHQNLAVIEKEKAALLARQEDLLAQLALSNTPITLSTFTPSEKIEIFQQYFRGRHEVYPIRWQNSQGRSGYSIACHNEWQHLICQKPKIKCSECTHQNFKVLDSQAIYDHLSGKHTVGIYPLLSNNHCYFLAADFDKADWQAAVQSYTKACKELDVPYAVERSRSGNGAHIWIFFSEPAPAKEARLLGFRLLDRAMEFHAGLSFASYDRLFPNQDIMPAGGFGNLIALPLQNTPRQSGNSVFIDEDGIPYRDQWQFLNQLKKLALTDLYNILEQVNYQANNSQQLKQPPWEQGLPIKASFIDGCPKKLALILANQIYIPLKTLPSALTARLKRLASFANPEFFKKQAMRFSTHGIPRYICCSRIEQNYLILPRGCFEEVMELMEQQKIQTLIDDKRHVGQKFEDNQQQKSEKVQFRAKLRKDQSDAVAALLKHDTGVLVAPTAFGKTVTAIGLIARRGINTLVLTHSRQLVEQWQERLKTFIQGIEIGVIKGGKRKPSNQIDIATYQSLINKKDNSIDPLLFNYGQVIVDECHHVSAPRFELLLSEARAKYIVGLTATPERRDGHQSIIFMQVGPIRHRIKQNSIAPFEQSVVVRSLSFSPPDKLQQTDNRPLIADVYRWLMTCEKRNSHILKDAVEEIEKDRNPVILTERREHADELGQQLIARGYRVQVLRGAMKAKERRDAKEGIKTAQVIIATGKYLGEGFDLPRLDTLLLALPIAWKGTLAQYAGRIHRQADNKKQVTIYDYVDTGLPMLQRMFQRRFKGYDVMGYQVKEAQLA